MSDKITDTSGLNAKVAGKAGDGTIGQPRDVTTTRGPTIVDTVNDISLKSGQTAAEVAAKVLKNSPTLKEKTKQVIKPELVGRIYAAEKKRMSWYEHLGIDGDTVGRGQLSNKSYSDVKKFLSKEFDTYLKKMNLKINKQLPYDNVCRDPVLEDFIVLACLALWVDRSQRVGRTATDALKFGIGKYHGAYATLVESQKRVGNEIDFDPVEKDLQSQGSKEKDLVDYINEIAQ